jgi:type VI secretion system secreted protein VgrG
MESIGGNRSLTIGSEKYPADQMERVYGNKDLEVWKQKKERIRQMSELRVDEDYHTNVLKNYSLFVEENANYSTTKDRREIVSGNADFSYMSKRKTKVVQDDLMKVNGKWHVNGGDIVIQGDTAITLVVGGNFIKIDASGVTIVGSMVKINSGGAPGTLTPVGTADGASGRVPVEPKEPTPADNDKTGDKSTLPAPPT